LNWVIDEVIQEKETVGEGGKSDVSSRVVEEMDEVVDAGIMDDGRGHEIPRIAEQVQLEINDETMVETRENASILEGIVAFQEKPGTIYRYGCLYCRRNGSMAGLLPFKKVKAHRATCVCNPKRREQLNACSREFQDSRDVKKKKDKKVYWLNLAPRIWACRVCVDHGEVWKTWSSKSWVRNHWLRCHNERPGGKLPHVRSKTQKKSGKRQLKARAKEINKMQVGFL
jgi:hypothetical protein